MSLKTQVQLNQDNVRQSEETSWSRLVVSNRVRPAGQFIWSRFLVFFSFLLFWSYFVLEILRLAISAKYKTRSHLYLPKTKYITKHNHRYAYVYMNKYVEVDNIIHFCRIFFIFSTIGHSAIFLTQ